MPDMMRKATWLNVVLVCAYVYYVWSVARALSDESETEHSAAVLYDRLSRLCYRVAYWFGSMGIEAEVKRDSILSEGRMN